MTAESSTRWRIATGAAAIIWMAFAIALMIADVWDETNGMLAFSSPSMTLGEKIHFVATQSLGFWRPIPTLFVATVLHFVRDFDLSWRLLRGVNIVMLLAAVALMIDALRRWTGASARLQFVTTVALLFSASAVITAGWFANVFDASALLLTAVAAWLLARGHAVAAGVAIGVAFFCKETAALALPFLLMLLVGGHLTLRQALRAGIPAAILGVVYFAIRSQIVPFGSAADVHTFAPDQLWPTIVNLSESFWRQTLEPAGPRFLGFVWLVVSLAALRRPRLIGAALLFLGATAVIYWGMFGEYQNGVLIHHLNFVGRLFLIPAALMLFVLALQRQTVVIAVLCIPIVIGGVTTWRNHAAFQRTYQRIYRSAPITVHYPPKPLEDSVRGVRIGDLPDAGVKIDARTGRLLPRQ